MPEMSLDQLIDQLDDKLDVKLSAQAAISKVHWDALRRECVAGFDGINKRLDKVNGRLDKHGDRLVAIERHPRLQPRASDDAARIVPSEDRSITRRDVTVGIACAGGGIAVLLWILQVVGKL